MGDDLRVSQMGLKPEVGGSTGLKKSGVLIRRDSSSSLVESTPKTESPKSQESTLISPERISQDKEKIKTGVLSKEALISTKDILTILTSGTVVDQQPEKGKIGTHLRLQQTLQEINSLPPLKQANKLLKLQAKLPEHSAQRTIINKYVNKLMPEINKIKDADLKVHNLLPKENQLENLDSLINKFKNIPTIKQEFINKKASFLTDEIMNNKDLSSEQKLEQMVKLNLSFPDNSSISSKINSLKVDIIKKDDSYSPADKIMALEVLQQEFPKNSLIKQAICDVKLGVVLNDQSLSLQGKFDALLPLVKDDGSGKTKTEFNKVALELIVNDTNLSNTQKIDKLIEHPDLSSTRKDFYQSIMRNDKISLQDRFSIINTYLPKEENITCKSYLENANVAFKLQVIQASFPEVQQLQEIDKLEKSLPKDTGSEALRFIREDRNKLLEKGYEEVSFTNLNEAADKLKTFETKFKTAIHKDNFFMNFFGDTKGVLDAFNNLSTSFKDDPGDLNLALKNINKLQSKIQTFIDKHPDSTKLGWMNFLNNKMNDLKSDIIESKPFKLQNQFNEFFKDVKIDPRNMKNLESEISNNKELLWLFNTNGENKDVVISQIKNALKESPLNKKIASTSFANKIYDIMVKSNDIKVGDMSENVLNNNKNAEHFSEKQLPFSKISVGGKEYENKGEIARGAFGLVSLFKANDGSAIAVKLFGNNKEAFKEMDAHRQACSVKNENVVDLMGSIQDKNGNIYSVMEFADGVDVAELIGELQNLKKESFFSDQDDMLIRRYLGRTMLEGIKHTNEMGVIHSDYKPMNVFYDKNKGVGKTGDFGNSVTTGSFDVTGKGLAKNEYGTANFIATEIQEGSTIKLSDKTDLFAYGASLSMVVTGDLPLNTSNQSQTDKELTRLHGQGQSILRVETVNEFGEKTEISTPTSYANVINNTFKIGDRLEASELLESDFFGDIDDYMADKAKQLLFTLTEMAEVTRSLRKASPQEKPELLLKKESLKNDLAVLRDKLNNAGLVDQTEVSQQKVETLKSQPIIDKTFLHSQLLSKVTKID